MLGDATGDSDIFVRKNLRMLLIHTEDVWDEKWEVNPAQMVDMLNQVDGSSWDLFFPCPQIELAWYIIMAYNKFDLLSFCQVFFREKWSDNRRSE